MWKRIYHDVIVAEVKEKEIYIILENIRSAENVGAIFRTADATDVTKIYLVGYTPSPIDRFGREQKKIAKAALGAEKVIPFETYEDTKTLIEKLRMDGVKIIAVEQDRDATDYKEIKINGNTAFIFGNEVDGVSKEILKECDEIAKIPMKGEKESLNVSVSVGVFLYRVLGV